LEWRLDALGLCLSLTYPWNISYVSMGLWGICGHLYFVDGGSKAD
jgi:hypothetical protein